VQIMAEVLKQHRAARAGVASAAPRAGVDRAAAIAAAGEALFASPHQATVGARDGDVTLVEFFDYNCGFCKRALADTIALAESDPHLKIVLKDLPILGPGSTAAARVAIAARMQEPDGAR
jgi:protein-disulfide isomerase